VPDPPAQEKEGIARWWDTISHHPLWAAIIATLIAAAIIAHSGAVFGGSSSASSDGASVSPDAAVRLGPSIGVAAIPKPIADVTTPPSYTGAEAGDHCGLWWKGWFQQQHAASLNLPPYVEVSAPQNDPVTITRIIAHVFHAYKPSGISLIECLRGAGPIPGTIVSLDLDHPSVLPTVGTSDDNSKPMPLPDAAIAIDPGHTEYLSLVPKGTRGFYEWSATLQFTVNQKTETREVGSLKQPLRSWLGFGSAPTVNAGYDYDVATRSWRLLSPPSCVENLETCPPATSGGPAAKESPAAVFEHLIPDGARACGNGIGVNSGYNCEAAQTVIETLKASDPPATGRIAIVVHSGLLTLPMECVLNTTVDVCRSTDDQNLNVALLH
jgi:hypothetical protein